jgi:hypothetical protein
MECSPKNSTYSDMVSTYFEEFQVLLCSSSESKIQWARMIDETDVPGCDIAKSYLASNTTTGVWLRKLKINHSICWQALARENQCISSAINREDIGDSSCSCHLLPPSPHTERIAMSSGCQLHSISSPFNVLNTPISTTTPIDAKTHVWPIYGIAHWLTNQWLLLGHIQAETCFLIGCRLLRA